MPYIIFDNIYYTYNAGTDTAQNALNGVSFSIEQGEFVAIIGHNGSGKSTLARLANGLLLPDSGTITVDGLATTDKKATFEIRKRVGLVFQNPDSQMVASIIEDDVAFGPENLGLPRDEIEKRVAFALEAVGMTEHRKGTPFRLSGGQKQRIAIAGVLALQPRVLILDESTAMLDPKGRQEVLDTALKLRQEHGIAVVLITHFLSEALRADKVIVLNKGKIAMQGAPKQVLTQGTELESLSLEMPFAARVADKLRKGGLELPNDILETSELLDELVAQKSPSPFVNGQTAPKTAPKINFKKHFTIY